MAIWKKVFLWSLLAVAVLLAGMYIFLALNGRRLFNEQASSLTNRKVTVQAIRVRVPAVVVLDGLSAEGLLGIQRARLSIDPLAILRGRLRIISAELTGPVLFLERGPDAKLALPRPAGGAARPAGTGPAGTASAPVPVVVQALSVSGGEVRLKDQASGREWAVKDIRGALRDVPLTGTPAKTSFLVTASLAGMDLPFVGDSLKAQGWLNWAAKDMDARVQAGDDEGRLGLNAQLLSAANVLKVAGHISLSGGRSGKDRKRQGGAVEKSVLGVLGALSGAIEADFSFTTAMDKFALPDDIPFRGKFSSELKSGQTLGTIVDEMRTVGEELLQKEAPDGR